MVSLVSERRAAVWVPVLVFRLLIGVCPAVMGSGCVWAEDLRGWRQSYLDSLRGLSA